MLFFTRELCDGCQYGSGWTRKATANLNRNEMVYKEYFTIISRFLSESVIHFSKYDFHDAELVNLEIKKNSLKLVLDLAGCPEDFTNRFAIVSFKGRASWSANLPKIDEWWLYNELHLDDRNQFCLHILFTHTDFRMSADSVTVVFRDRTKPKRKIPKSTG